MIEYPELTPEEADEFASLSGKRIDSGIDKTQADIEALAEILQRRKEKLQQSDRRPRFEKLGDLKITAINWVIKGLFAAGDLTMLYGDSGTYKSFWAIALALCVSIGVDFFGLPIRKRGAVYYVAGEGSAGLLRRAMAWCQDRGYDLKGAPFYRYSGVANLIEGAGVLTAALDEAVKDNGPTPPALIVFDTLQRCLGGDDSDTRDASEGLAALDKLRTRFPETVILLVHHCGQTDKSRARGAYLLKAALDQEFRLERADPKNPDDRTVVMTHTKAKESEPAAPMAFGLKQVVLADENGQPIKNEDGEPETSAILETVDYIPHAGEATGKNQKIILEILGGASDGKMCLSDLLEVFKSRTGKRKSQFDQAIVILTEKNFVFQEVGFLCLKR